MDLTKEYEDFIYILVIIFSHFMFYKLHTFNVLPFRMASRRADLGSGEASTGLFNLGNSICGGGGGGGTALIGGGGGGILKSSENN